MAHRTDDSPLARYDRATDPSMQWWLTPAGWLALAADLDAQAVEHQRRQLWAPRAQVCRDRAADCRDRAARLTRGAA